MSINVSVYSNGNNTSQSIYIDFAGDVLAPSFDATDVACYQYFFKFTTSGRGTDDAALPVKITKSLSDLALFDRAGILDEKQSASNTANAYGDIKSMVIDYCYDFIHGHTADQYLSGCTEQKPMKFN